VAQANFPGVSDSAGKDGMSLGWALLYLLGLYAVVGLAFGLAFVARGVTQVLEHPSGVSVGARMLLFPASAALWPLLLRRWLKAKPPT
jgi:hypothetical protein